MCGSKQIIRQIESTATENRVQTDCADISIRSIMKNAIERKCEHILGIIICKISISQSQKPLIGFNIILSVILS